MKECLPENHVPLSFPREFSTGGGILLIHRKDISISVIRTLCNKDFEIVTCRVLSLKYPITFICSYRPPSGNLQLFLEKFHDLLVNFCLNTSCVVVISIFTAIECVQPRMLLKVFLMSLDWYSQLNYLLIRVLTLLILSLEHKRLKYVLLVSPHWITSS